MLTKKQLEEMKKVATRDSDEVAITTALLLHDIKDLLSKNSPEPAKEPAKKAPVAKAKEETATKKVEPSEVNKVDKSRTNKTSRKKT